MAVWAVYNGYRGCAPVAALVSAPTEQDARAQAREVFAADHQAGDPDYCEPSRCELLKLPTLVELG